MQDLIIDSDIGQLTRPFIDSLESLSNKELEQIITESLGELPASIDHSREGLLDLIAGLMAIGMVDTN